MVSYLLVQARFHYRHYNLLRPDALLVELAKECNHFQREISALITKHSQNVWSEESAKQPIKRLSTKNKKISALRRS